MVYTTLFESSDARKKKLEAIWAPYSYDAIKALSETLNKKVDITEYSAKIMRANDVPKLLNPSDITTTVVWVKVDGSIQGVIVLCASLRNILNLADILLHKEIGYFRDLSNENLSVIHELSNIISGYYVDGLIELFGENLQMKSPELSANPHKAIEFFGLGSIYKDEIDVLLFETDFTVPEHNVKGKTVLIFRKGLMGKILSSANKAKKGQRTLLGRLRSFV